jgi:glycosyltransferase involved in cell wall biosynthesis
MRIVQLIDSLEAGGAERMAVNYANALQSTIEFSGLATTRKEGSLKEQINPKVSYLFINKSKTIDFQAVKKLYQYCKINKINYIHAHSSSYFLAFLTKIILPNVKIIWHIHNGNFTSKSFLNVQLNKFLSVFIYKIIAVNKEIDLFVNQKISKKSIYLENFSITNNLLKITKLNGFENKKIVQIANLKYPKNHIFTIEIAKIINSKFPDWSFHLVGKDFEDDYSKELKARIKKYNLENHVFIYGAKLDTEYIISQAAICILTSESEGLPVALIEYGMQKKPVVVTAVGEIPNILKNKKYGYLSPVNNVVEFANNYSEEKVIHKYLSFLN